MVELVVRVVFSLAVVLGLLWFIARSSSRRFGGPARSLVRVVARQPLARAASLAVVEVGDRVLVVGVSENGVRLLTEMDPSELPLDEPGPETHAADADAGSGRHLATPLAVALLRRPGPRAGRRSAAVGETRPRTLDGSLLSGQTWRQAWASATRRNGTSDE